MPNDTKLALRFDTQVSHCLVITTHPGIRESHKVNIFRMNLVPINTADLSLSFREYRFFSSLAAAKNVRNPKSNIKNESSLFKHHSHTVPADCLPLSECYNSSLHSGKVFCLHIL